MLHICYFSFSLCLFVSATYVCFCLSCCLYEVLRVWAYVILCVFCICFSFFFVCRIFTLILCVLSTNICLFELHITHWHHNSTYKEQVAFYFSPFFFSCMIEYVSKSVCLKYSSRIFVVIKPTCNKLICMYEVNITLLCHYST